MYEVITAINKITLNENIKIVVPMLSKLLYSSYTKLCLYFLRHPA